MALYTLYFLRLALDSDAIRYLRKDPPRPTLSSALSSRVEKRDVWFPGGY